MSQRRAAAAARQGLHSETTAVIAGSNSPLESRTTSGTTSTLTTTTPTLINNNHVPSSSAAVHVVKGSLALETAETIPLADEAMMTEGLATPERRGQRRIKHWKESPFAVGLTEPTWLDERRRRVGGHLDDDDHQDDGDDEELFSPPLDDSGCLCCSAHVCPLLGATRVGNMSVLWSSTEWVEEVELDEETGQESVHRYKRPRLDIVVGPYWPMLCFVTYPLILAVSGWTLVSGIWPGRKPPILVVIWTLCTVGLIVALACTGLRDPGIMYRHSDPPPQYDNSWKWSDQAQTYRPRHAFYDADTAVVVEGFDHTCPWTGTAIGRKNMFCFQMFVCLVFVCMVLDIFILTGAF